jgi:hypothetical protein
MNRIVGLDLGEKISYCEIKGEEVVERATVAGIAGLLRLLGPNTLPAKVAFEACREAWAVHDQLRAWGHTPLMLDTTRVRSSALASTSARTIASTPRSSPALSAWDESRWRTSCPRTAGSCACS